MKLNHSGWTTLSVAGWNRLVPWPLPAPCRPRILVLHHGLGILHLQNVSPILTYLHNFHFLPSPTVPHFYSRLIQYNSTIVYLLDSMLYYVLSKINFSRTRRMRLFPCRQPELCRRPQTMRFFPF